MKYLLIILLAILSGCAGIPEIPSMYDTRGHKFNREAIGYERAKYFQPETTVTRVQLRRNIHKWNYSPK